MPDEDLAIYVREVDLEAYREIVIRYETKLLRYAMHMLGNELSAHEVVQEAFLDAFKTIHQFDPHQSFSNFIFRATHRAIIRHFSNKKHLNPGTYELISEEFMNEDDLENEFAEKKFLEHVLTHMRRLPLMYKEPLVLHFLEQKSYDEIVEILQIPSASVAVRIAYGKTKIKKYAQN